MSLGIDVDKVVRVLLADGWHDVHDNSFTLDSYEYLWWEGGSGPRADRDPMILHGGGRSGVCATGFAFTTLTTPDGAARRVKRRMSGPLTAILAVEEKVTK
jgi:hypothetical protein